MIHFKFKSSLDYDTVSFEGAGLPVWELKKEIASVKKLGQSNDFDLVITNAQTNEDYSDEYQMVPKNTSVVVRRVPMSTSSASKKLHVTPLPSTSRSSYSSAPTVSSSHSNEDARIQAMMTESTAHWDRSSEEMAEQQQYHHDSSSFKRFIPKRNHLNAAIPAKIPPPSYTCYRCGLKGHFINFCPTNADPNFKTPRIKKTTGIPKTFLKPASSPSEDNVMIASDGTLVAVAPNEAMWNRMTAAKSILDTSVIPSHLKCPICKGLMKEAIEMPCCGAAYCDDCVRTVLIGPEEGTERFSDKFICPSCKRNPIYPDTLLPNKIVRRAVDELLKGMSLGVMGKDDSKELSANIELIDAATNVQPPGNATNASDKNESASISLNESGITSDKKSIDSQTVDNGKILSGGIDTTQSNIVNYAHLSHPVMHQNVNAEDLMKTMQHNKKDSQIEAVTSHSPSKNISQREHNHVQRSRDYDRERSRSPSRDRCYTKKRSRSRSVDRARNPGKERRDRSRSRSRSRHSRDYERRHYHSRK